MTRRRIAIVALALAMLLWGTSPTDDAPTSARAPAVAAAETVVVPVLPPPPRAELAQDRRAERIAAAVLERLVVPSSRARQPYHWGYCRTAPMGCRARVRAIADAVVREADRAGVRPELVAAVAWSESRWNPLATGQLGEVGLLQLLPAKARAAGLRLDDPRRAGRCFDAPDGCAREVLAIAAPLLRRAIAACRGSEREGLCQYNTGRCMPQCGYAAGVAAAESWIGGAE